MDTTVQKTIARSKRLEEERHNFHSRLIEADKEVGILKVCPILFVHLGFIFFQSDFFLESSARNGLASPRIN